MFRKRDISIFVASVVAIIICLESSNDILISISWFIEPSQAQGRFTNDLPAPVVTDLNGDGMNEVLMITDDYILKMVTIENVPGADSSGPTARAVVQSQVNLLAGVRISQGRLPVGMGQGYLDKYQSGIARQQVVCVVSKDWRVACYSSFDNPSEPLKTGTTETVKRSRRIGLRLLWETVLEPTDPFSEKLGTKYTMEEVFVLITPQQAKEGDRGLIIIGGSHSRQTNAHSHKVLLESEDNIDNNDPTLMDVDPQRKESVTHFNMYALEGGTGQLRWSHTGRGSTVTAGIQKEKEKGKTELKQEQILNTHQFKVGELHLREWGAAGAWLHYRRSMIEALPHSYFGPKDAKLRLARFEREQSARASKKMKHHQSAQRNSPNLSNLLKSVPLTATLPHDEQEHIQNPNVVLAHTHHGVEAISLRTGKLVAELTLNQNTVFVDVNGDGVVEQIQVTSPVTAGNGPAHDIGTDFFNATHSEVLAEARRALLPDSHEKASLPACFSVVLSGLPPRDLLFTAPLCRFTGPGDLHPHDAVPKAHWRSKPDDNVALAPPIVVTSMEDFTDKDKKSKDIIFATNTGVVSSYSSDGLLRWQVRRGPTWDKASGKGYVTELPVYSSDTFSFTNKKADQILVVGDDEFVVFSKNGDYEGAGSFPQRLSVQKPIIGDFNNDGINDVIFICEDALLGYSIYHVVKTRFLLVLVLLLVVTLVVVFASQLHENSDYVSKRKAGFEVPRATD